MYCKNERNIGFMNEMGYWFVSHSSKDIKIVEQIVNVLKECGIPYWKAPEMIPAGSNYAKEIPMALKNCSIFLFIVSNASQSSIWVEKELDSAVNARKNIIPVRIDDTPLSDMYTFYMNNIQMIDIQIQADGRISKDSLEILHTKFKECIPKQIVVSEAVQEPAKDGSPIYMKEDVEVLEKTYVQNEMERNKIDNRTNAFRINKIPVFCDECGMKLEQVEVGTYRCSACNIDYYDDFKKIRNYLRDNGPAPAILIARNTGVPKQTVEYYFSDDIKISPKEMDFVQTRSTKTRRQVNTDCTGKWRSSIWIR